MGEYVTRADRKVGKNPQAIVKYLAKLNRQGLSQKEIGSRFDIPRSTVGDYLRGSYSPSRKHSEGLALMINNRNAEQAFSLEVPNVRGNITTLEPINKSERDKARAYRDEIQKLARSEEYDLSKFKGKSIRVRGKKGIEKYEFVVEEETLNKMAKQGQLPELKFYRNKGS